MFWLILGFGFILETVFIRFLFHTNNKLAKRKSFQTLIFSYFLFFIYSAKWTSKPLSSPRVSKSICPTDFSSHWIVSFPSRNAGRNHNSEINFKALLTKTLSWVWSEGSGPNRISSFGMRTCEMLTTCNSGSIPQKNIWTNVYWAHDIEPTLSVL